MNGPHTSTAYGPNQEGEGDPHNGSVRSQRIECKSGTRRTSRARRKRRGHPQAACAPSTRHSGEGDSPKPRYHHKGTLQSACTPGAQHAGTGRRGGGTINPKGEGVPPPELARMPFMRGLTQEMGGNPQDLRRPSPQCKTKRGGG